LREIDTALLDTAGVRRIRQLFKPRGAFRFLPQRNQRERRALPRRRTIPLRQPGKPILIGDLGVLIDLGDALLQLLLLRLRKRSGRRSQQQGNQQD
jgi:hypothetical protein